MSDENKICNIEQITNSFYNLDHNFTKSVDVPTVSWDKVDTSSASTAWVDNAIETRIPSKPTINVPVLTPMWFDHTVDSRAWLKSELERNSDNDYGWKEAQAYPVIYDHLNSDLVSKEPITENITGITESGTQTSVNSVTYYLANDGHRIILNTNGANIDKSDEIFDAFGGCEYYVLDNINGMFKLPRQKSVVGNGKIRCLSNNGINSTVGICDATENNTVEKHLYFSTINEGSGGEGGGGSGGVIDGTILSQKYIMPTEWTGEYTYVVKNDCMLNVEYLIDTYEGCTYGIVMYINDVVYSSATDRDIFFQITHDIVIKAGTRIKLKTSTNTPPIGRTDAYPALKTLEPTITNYFAKFTEYRLRSANIVLDGMGAPDYNKAYDISKKVGIDKNTGFVAPEDGYISINFAVAHDASDFDLFKGYINDVCVFCQDAYNVWRGACDGFYPIKTKDVFYANKGNKTLDDSNYAEVRFIPALKNTARVYGDVVESKSLYDYKDYKSGIWYNNGDWVKYNGKYYCCQSTNGTNTIPRPASEWKITDSVEFPNTPPTLWYRVYSDGWCEQGGHGYFADCEVKFAKAFTNTSYTVNIVQTTSYKASTPFVIRDIDRTNQSFTLTYGDKTWHPGELPMFDWTARGYIDIKALNPEIKKVYLEGDIPDWNESLKIDVKQEMQSADNKSYKFENTGYLLFNGKGVSDSADFKINNITIYNSYHQGNVSSPIKVGNGDVITIEESKKNDIDNCIADISFYPTKSTTVARKCISYVIESDSGNCWTTYNSANSYKVGDCVEHTENGSKYYCVCVKNCDSSTNTLPAINVASNTYWFNLTYYDRGGSANINRVMVKPPTYWYRLYSDGWCEQGGRCNGDVFYTFKKPFLNEDYTITLTNTNDRADNERYAPAVDIIQNDGFLVFESEFKAWHDTYYFRAEGFVSKID